MHYTKLRSYFVVQVKYKEYTHSSCTTPYDKSRKGVQKEDICLI